MTFSTGQVERYRYELAEAFAVQHVEGTKESVGLILADEDFTVKAIRLRHHGISLGYIVHEKPRLNVPRERLAQFGLQPGPWMKDLKNPSVTGEVTIGGQAFSLDKLRAELLVVSPGQSIAYLTDFLLDDETFGALAQCLRGTDTVVCEAQYRHQDLELAQRNHHTTIQQVATLAASAQIGTLMLFHLSDRYTNLEWAAMLEESQALFDNSHYPEHWCVEPAVRG